MSQKSGSYFYSLLFCTSSQSGWPTCHNTHFFFLKMSGLVVSEFFCQVPEHRENLSKRTDFYSVLQREQHSSCRQPASQDLRHYLVFQLFGSGKSTLGVIVLLHSGGSRPTCFVQPGRRTCLTAAITPTPSENIIDLDIKRAVRLQIRFHACLILQCGFGGRTLFFPVQANVTC